MKYRSDVKVELIDFMGGDAKVVQSARTSTLGDSRGVEANAGLINYLVREKHHSPLESSVFTFYIEAPIFVTRQLIRHRIASFNEASGRYKVLEPEFYLPPEDRPLVQVGKTGDYQFEKANNSELWQGTYHVLAEACEFAWDHYTTLIDAGVAKEVARMILPVNIYSQMYITVNARSLMNIIELRADDHAQYEIQLVAREMDRIFKSQMPLTHAAWEANREL